MEGTVFLDVDFPHRRAEERSLLAPIILIVLLFWEESLSTIKEHVLVTENKQYPF